MQIQKFLAEQLEGFEWPEDLVVLVCGGREFGDLPEDYLFFVGTPEVEAKLAARKAQYNFIWDVLHALDDLHVAHKEDDNLGKFTIVNGKARGADSASSDWRNKRISPSSYPLKEYPADWTKHGRSAGSIRNQLMLCETQPHIVLAFPGGGGTADMVRKAKRRGGKVIEVPYPLNN